MAFKSESPVARNCGLGSSMGISTTLDLTHAVVWNNIFLIHTRLCLAGYQSEGYGIMLPSPSFFRPSFWEPGASLWTLWCIMSNYDWVCVDLPYSVCVLIDQAEFLGIFSFSAVGLRMWWKKSCCKIWYSLTITVYTNELIFELNSSKVFTCWRYRSH